MSFTNKIVVIADDFTGAAEVGGIGLRHGLNVVIETKPVGNPEADLIIIATDTRSMGKEEAAKFVSELTKKIVDQNPRFLYKKIDSVLRGNVSEELIAQMKVMQKVISVIIPANPVFKRVIKSGKYFIDEIPLNETCFSKDSQYPIKSADVISIMSNSENYPVISLKHDSTLPEKGLIIGDVENVGDLAKWAAKVNDTILFSGAAGFFESILLELQFHNKTISTPFIPFGSNALFVLGSSYPKDAQVLSTMIKNGHFFSNMPVEIYSQENYPDFYLEKWIYEVSAAIKNHNKVIIASMHNNSNEDGISFRIKKIIAELVKEVNKRIKIDELLIEGGSTTSEILKELNITKLIPIRELDAGVIRMCVEGRDLCITTKPGSYQWPKNVWLQSEIDSFYAKKIIF